MEMSDVVTLLIHGNQLKRTIRSGWGQRGVPEVENVAAHSYGTAFIALVMVELIKQPMNLKNVLFMSLLHDLPEGITTDIPAPAWRLFPTGVKSDVENTAMQKIFGDLPFKKDFLSYWDELQKGETAEARLVHDCDKLDMYLQALMYELETGNQKLGEFWRLEYEFEFKEAQALFDELARLRLQTP
jgi:putative hydrolase of HD superfamily